MNADPDRDALLEALRGDSRAVALLRREGETLAVVAASDGLRDALGSAEDEALLRWIDGLGGMAMLERHAETRKRLELHLDNGKSIAASVRRQSGGVYQLRGTFVDQMDVSNTMTASAIATLANDDIGVIFLDEKLRVLAVNEAYFRFFPATEGYPNYGGSFETMLRSAIKLGYLPQARGREDKYVRSTIRNFTAKDAGPLTALTGNGHWITTSRLRFRNGAMAILLVDVTRSQKELEQFQSFMRNTHDMIYARVSTDLKTLKIWGQDSEALLNSRENGKVKLGEWLAAVHPDDRDAYIAAGERRIRHGEPYRIEYRYRDLTTGEPRWMLENAWVTEDRATGEKHLDAYLIDITERKLVEAELQHREDRFREFAAIAADWYFEADPDMNLTFLSDSFAEVSGIPASRFVGHSWTTITRNVLKDMPEENRQPWLDLLEAWHNREPVRNLALLFRFGGGRDRQININGDPVFDAQGRYVGYRGVGKDVTSLIAAQQEALAARRRAEAANRAKSEFIANMSHELRTPLNAIIGFASVMEQQMFGPLENRRYREYASDISASGQHLLSLVNDILDLSRIEAERLKIEPEPIPLTEELERAVALFRDDFGSRHIELAIRPESAAVTADRRAFRQMVINLLNNAIKFTGEDGRIRLGAEACGGHVRIFVEDNGIGMTDDDISLAMEPFGRAANAEIAGGTGLGLPITKKLVELNGGELEIASLPGSGTRVSLLLPGVRPPEMAASA
ncbi:MAG: PAS domain-containing sensor histidine kinase [Minwuia sp.]|uniref:sensor histidine kinase n=1 Tax=Minwuia sp. TaxID=2493630 RepID=UPI003A8B8AA7